MFFIRNINVYMLYLKEHFIWQYVSKYFYARRTANKKKILDTIRMAHNRYPIEVIVCLYLKTG